ncbi:MAG: sulfotransferase [bacterium]|nr:sulfotransferase [bacterium]
MNKPPVLVTGAHRSGTTWVGTTLAKSNELCYIFEPFNKEFGPAECRSAFRNWYSYINNKNQQAYTRCIQRLLEFKISPLRELKEAKTRWQYRNGIQNVFNFQLAKLKKQRPLFKDPIAIFSTPWLAKKFDFQVVVLIRHPAAFVSSLKRLDWRFPFGEFLCQPFLMQELPEHYIDQIEEYADNPPPVVSQAILLWNLVYSRVLEYQKQYPHWQYIRHEDISLNPVEEFKSLFEKLNLQFTPTIERHIQSTTATTNPGESPQNKATQLKRNSKENIHNWKKRLTPEEIETIKKETNPVASKFYSSEEW